MPTPNVSWLCVVLLACGLLGASGCARARGAESVEDDEPAGFLSVPADSGSVAEGTASARAVLRVANELSAPALRQRVHLSARVVANMTAYRAGDDGRVGTSDDERFDTIAELDALPLVGPAGV